VYENNKPVRIANVVISTQHAADVSHKEIERFCIENVIKKCLPARMMTNKTEFLINPTGRFVVGGPQGDTGLTGRKIIVDSYGGMGRHGGGAFSGKDPSKVDRSAAYMGRWVAKNIVAAGLAARCEVQFAYAIGHPDPVSVHIDTFGRHRGPAEPAAPDLLEDDQLRSLRQERQGPHLGSDQQGRGAAEGALSRFSRENAGPRARERTGPFAFQATRSVTSGAPEHCSGDPGHPVFG
jgi:hypothetical protein